MEKMVGLTSEEATRRLSEFGPNTITTKEKISALEIFLSQFPNVINLILFLAAFLAFALGETVDGGFILVILLLNGLFGFIQEYRAEKTVAALKKFVVAEARVLRDGQEQMIPVSEIVPADVLIFSEGEKIAADGKLIKGAHIEIDEAILTGESLPVLKTIDSDNALFMGTTVVRGHGQLLVEKTGSKTRFGEIAKTLTEIKGEKTPLHIRIDRLGKQIALAVLLIGGIIMAVGFAQGREFFSILLTAVSVSVAAIPEGLPAVITIALALGMQRMAKRRAVVRKMAAVETLGATQVILTDKTGTLTQNKMRVKKLWYEGDKESLRLLLKACVLGNTAALVQEEGEDGLDIIGDKTDGALLLFTKDHVENLETFKTEGEVLDEYVFDSTTKTITVLWKDSSVRHGQVKELVFVRGAPERILEKSSHAFWHQNKVLVNDEVAVKITGKFREFAEQGLRIIGFGYREVVDGGSLKREELEKDLTFLGFAGIYDAPRAEAKEAIKQAGRAGIRVVMVTGDNEITALSIAKEVGLIEKNEDLMTGSQLRSLTDQELLTILPKTRIFARTTPQDKFRLVELFKSQGLVVGVTGDGVNDALAIKRADVGLAMGLTGTDVAKEASDIVVTDDNFASLVSAIEEGRTIYDNIVKAITFLLSANLAEVATIFLAILFGLPTPLLPTQILWINLVTDGLPALALASDTKDPDILKRLPRNPKEHILTKNTLQLILWGGLVMTLITLLAFILSLNLFGQEIGRAVVFNLLIGIQMVFIFFVRGGKHPLSNRFLLFAISTSLLLQIVIMVNPVLRSIFHIQL